jgi:hypothetical protein
MRHGSAHSGGKIPRVKPRLLNVLAPAWNARRLFLVSIPAFVFWVAGALDDDLNHSRLHYDAIRPIGITLFLVYTVLLASWRVRRFVETRVRKDGVCRQCGYDLRATPARCPECGTIAAAPALE